jgi:transposase
VHESVVDVADGARTTSPLSSGPTECGCAYRKKPVVIAIGDGASFAKGRDFAAWLGLVPRQMSTGDRTILGRITKRGNRYLRMLFIQGARAIQLHPASWAKHSFWPVAHGSAPTL